MSHIVDQEQPVAPAQPAKSAKGRGRGFGRPWPPGISGNPQGRRLLKGRSEALERRRNALRAMLASEYPKSSGLECALLDQASDALAEAELGGPQRVPLARLGLELLKRVEAIRKERGCNAAAAPKAPPRTLADIGVR